MTDDRPSGRPLSDPELYQVHRGYARLQRDPQAWADYQAELAE